MSIHEPQSLKASSDRQPSVTLPSVPALTVSKGHAIMMTSDGEIQTVSFDRAQQLTHKKPVFVCYRPYIAQRLNSDTFFAYDILELYAFVHPAAFCVPTIRGVCQALGLNVPQDHDDEPIALLDCATALLQDLQTQIHDEDTKSKILNMAAVMGLNGRGWLWTPFVFEALGHTYNPQEPILSSNGLNVWKKLDEWAEQAPPPPPSHHSVTGEESRERLKDILGPDSEDRPQQQEYATRITAAFRPAETPDHPHVVLAEAGTGVGKTLGYLAPSTVWAEKNEGSVWISTYTKNLQRQVYQELDRIYPDKDIKQNKVAVRKGRENYLCLLNFEDMAKSAALAKTPDQAIAAGIMARWTEATNDGDLQGGDFPGWLISLLGFRYTRALSDRRGECIYSACDHYHKCFVERAVRRSKHASLVVANHALVMIQTALATPDEILPQRYIFDEAHHLFDAADSAFAGHLSGQETHDLRRWIRGTEGGKRSRARGLRRRVEDLISGSQEEEAALDDIIHATQYLPAQGWLKRIGENQPQGPTENFLTKVYKQVYTRAPDRHAGYSIEVDPFPLAEGVEDSARTLMKQLRKLQQSMRTFISLLRKKLEEQGDTLDSDTNKRLEAVSNSLQRRSEFHLAAWIDMLDALLSGETAEGMVDWMEVIRLDGKAFDIGLYRHHIDPMKPFSNALKPHAHGVAITAATLRDKKEGASASAENPDENAEPDWSIAKQRSGADYLSPVPEMFSVASPYPYAERTKILIIDDVNKTDPAQVSNAYKSLFLASGGGALGLFTAIQRLRAVREHIIGPLETVGYPVYAQHCDDMDTGTLVDMFREEPHACLLGTDAVRDGIDVPGDSLRLLVYDRVPWPRPTILHKARRNVFGKKEYDDIMTRFKLKQAYGRLIRRADDKGVFVMLDSRLPSRLHNAFPGGVEIEKTGLMEACLIIKNFLHTP